MPYQEIAPILSVCFCLILAVFVASRGLKHVANLGFTLGMIGLGIKETSSAMIMMSPEDNILVLERAFLFAQAFMGGDGYSSLPPLPA